VQIQLDSSFGIHDADVLLTFRNGNSLVGSVIASFFLFQLSIVTLIDVEDSIGS
jgi:hypothetical protein